MKTAIIHYSAPPIVGGVEMVIQAHAEQFISSGLPLTIIAGQGDAASLPHGVNFIQIDEINISHPKIASATEILNMGKVPDSFDDLTHLLVNRLEPILSTFDHVIIHNVLTKHFNLPLTAALFHMIETGTIKNSIAWCHDLTWSSTRSRNKVYPAYPWELLRTYNDRITYVAISEQRRKEIIDTIGCTKDKVNVIYNGVDPAIMLGLSPENIHLIEKMDIFSADLILLMPVRITKAKNIELAMQILAEIKKLDFHPKLILTGPPDPYDPQNMAYYQSLVELRTDLGLEKEMLFVYEFGTNSKHGYILDRKDVPSFFRIADAMLMPSHREGFGMPLVEAAFLGVPIISTGVPALEEIIGENALHIAPDDDPADLAKRIVYWLKSNPNYINRVKMRQNFTWKSIFDRSIMPILLAEKSHI